MNKTVLLFFIVTLIVAGCRKQLDQSEEINIDQLKVSDAFEWNTSRNVDFILHNAPAGVIRFSSENESLLYLKYFSDGSLGDQRIRISLPSYTKKININGQVTEIQGTAVNVNFTGHEKMVVVNYSMAFNGTTDWIAIPGLANLTITNRLSMEAWVKATRHQTAKIVQKGDWDGFGLGQDLWNGWQAGMYMADKTTYLLNWGAGRPELNRWYHLAATYDGSVFRFYVDGTEVNNVALTKNVRTTTRPGSIGSDNGAQKFFMGLLDEISIWNIALTPEQVTESLSTPWTGNESGIKALWNFNEGSGNTVYDASPGQYNGTINGALFNTDVGYGNENDTDGDGVQNSYDDYPDDPERAFNNYYPALRFGSIAFEDLWPGKGDYDFNDLVIDYSHRLCSEGTIKP